MSMSCNESQRWISMKVDGQRIPFAVAGRLDEHLGACGPCGEFFSSASRRAAMLDGALRSPDAALKASILRRLEDEPGGAEPVPFPIYWTRARHAAALLVVAAGVWLALRYAAPGDPESSGITQIIVERDQWTADVFSHSDGSPMGRGTRQVRQVIWKPPGDGGGPGGGVEPAPVRLERQRTDYIRLVDYPYW
jgi:hypothetical protein